nr:mevalonate kinase [uncultured Leptotrichia sp.]
MNEKLLKKRKVGIGEAHSKIILIGEHSVVYGYPAIAIPLKDILVKCRIMEAKSKYFYNPEDTLSTAIYTALKYLKKENAKIKYLIESEIPTKRGMGSSAAVSIAAIRAVFDYFGRNLDNIMLEKMVKEAETVAHMNPSGLDAKTCLSDKALKFIKNKGFSYINLNLGAYLVVADTGVHGNTREAVENVRKMGDKAQPMLKKLGELTEKIEIAIQEKSLGNIGEIMNKANLELKKLNLTIEKSDILVEEALKNGALGAKISGGGLGGCIIALVENKEKAIMIGEKLSSKGAINIWIEKI